MPAYRYEDLVRDVSLDVPGCPRHLVDRAIKNAARELCVKSSVWREWIAFPAVANKTAYNLSPSSDAEIERIVSVQVEGSQIDKSLYRLDEAYRLVFDNGQQPTDDSGVDDFSSSSTYAVDDNVVKNNFFWKCVKAITTAGAWDESEWQWDDTVGIWVRVVLRPSFGASEMPEWLVERCAEGIIAGAKSQLMMEPGRPWGNPQLATYQRGLFNESLSRACVEASRQACFDEGYGYRKNSTDMVA